jgi:NAD(P)H dehydrogenase (quinone)
MRVLIIYAHTNPASFCHAVLERFADGLKSAGHACEILDLYDIGFDPVFKPADYLQFVDPTQLPDIAIIKSQLAAMSGGRLKQRLTAWWLKNKSASDLLALIDRQKPNDVRRHQEKVAAAEALVFIAPIFWMGFPAILKGWIERVFAYGFAYSLTAQGWKGDLSGRIPLLKHKKALIITPTFFAEEHYRQGWGAALTKAVDEWTFINTGIQNVEHVFLYAVNAADEETRAKYLQKAFVLGKDF